MPHGQGAERLVRLETFARVGHAARGVVYVLLGYFALTTSGGGNDATSVLKQIQEMPLSTVLLIMVGLGLLGWGVFRLFGAIVDIQGKGSDAEGLAVRGGHVLSGLFHMFLCYVAVNLAFGGDSADSTGQSKQAAASAAEQLPLGETLILLVGIGFALAGIQQLVKAVTGKFMQLLAPGTPDFVEWLGRAGYAARGIVFAALAWQVIEIATESGDASQAGIGGALDALREIDWLYTLVAAGLILFGIFSFAMARYRQVPDENTLVRLRSKEA
jgi:hypothetical protein